MNKDHMPDSLDPSATRFDATEGVVPAERPENQGNSFPHLPRYRIQKLLGAGGMGRVYLAFDPGLRRRVAIKLMRGDDLATMRRLVAEARAQARVKHDRVCQVYEVGEAQGQTYISMQYIEGEPLHRAELSLEEKVLVIKRAAEGVQAAHREGLIHRDIKPGNIMVERSEDGYLKPYVLDFGLARGRGTDHVDKIAGTPHFMSPEQARGELAALDRRTDIYSLGATLYALLTGKSPASGGSSREVIRNVLEEDPKPPRHDHPEIPADLQAIVLKCLQKNPSGRYASAREFADDLGRYLEGEPVRAQSRGFIYRAGKKIRKHRLVFGLAFLALLVAVTSLFSILNARREGRKREQWAREFTERVVRVENHARMVALSPAHDIRPDLEQARRMMAEIESAMTHAGPSAQGPGHYALGRGFLALGEDEMARKHLEIAWEAGFQRPRVANTLGIVWSRLYQKNLIAAERIRNPDARAARKREIASLYRETARKWLGQSRDAESPYPPEYGQALLAYYDGRFEEAIGLLADTTRAHAWFFEGFKLKGDIHLAMANTTSQNGDREGARVHFDLGRMAYDEAIRIGESVPENYQALGELHATMMRMALYSGGDVLPHYEATLNMTNRALALNAHHKESLLLSARCRRLYAESLMTGKGDPSGSLDHALEAATGALDIDPDVNVHLELGRIYRQRARYLQERGSDPRPDLRQAIASFDKIAAADRDYSFYVNFGLIYKVFGDYQATRGEDDMPYRDKAIDAYREAVRQNPAITGGLINLGSALFQRSEHGRGASREADLEEAGQVLGRALELNPEHFIAHYSLAQVYQVQAQVARGKLQDPLPWLQRALVSFERAHQINGGSPAPSGAMGWIQKELGQLIWERGGDPGPLLDQAIASLKTAVSLGPNYGAFHNNLGEALRVRADYLAIAGEDPGEFLAAALVSYGEAARLLPQVAIPRANLVLTHLIRARYELEREADPKTSFKFAESNLAEAQALGNQTFVRIAAARFHLLEGRWRAKRSLDPTTDWLEAETSLQKALQLSPDDPEALLLELRLKYDVASRATPNAVARLQEAWQALEKMAATSAPSAEVQAFRGALWLLKGKWEGDADGEWQEKARASFRAAFRRNSNLMKPWEHQARQLGIEIQD